MSRYLNVRGFFAFAFVLLFINGISLSLASAQTDHRQSEKTIGVELSEGTPEEEDPQTALQPLIDDALAVESGQPITEEAPSDIAKALLFGQVKSTYAFINQVMNRLHSPLIKDQNYSFSVSPIPFPNAKIFPATRKTVIDMGLFSLTENVDEFAYIIAHEMTHGNPEQLKAVKDDEGIERLLLSIPEVEGLEATQREEIRADLGAIKRMIEAGYNPWAAYNMQFKFAALAKNLKKKGFIAASFVGVLRTVSKGSETYFGSHPDSAVRMLAIKAYIALLSQQQDLSGVISQYERLPANISVLRARTKIYLFPFTSKWFGRGLDLIFLKQTFGHLAMKALVAVAATSPAATAYVLNATNVYAPTLNALKHLVPNFVRNGSLESFIVKGMLWGPGYIALGGGIYFGIQNPKSVLKGIKGFGKLIIKIPSGISGLASSITTRDPLLRDFDRYRNALEKNERIEFGPFLTYVVANLAIVQERLAQSSKVEGGRTHGAAISAINRLINSNKYPRRLASNILSLLNLYIKLAEPDQLEDLRRELPPDKLSVIFRDQKLMANDEARRLAQEVMASLTSSDIPRLDYAESLLLLGRMAESATKVSRANFEIENPDEDASDDEMQKTQEESEALIAGAKAVSSQDDANFLALNKFAYENFTKLSLPEAVSFLSALVNAHLGYMGALLLEQNHAQLLQGVYSQSNTDLTLVTQLRSVYQRIFRFEEKDDIPRQTGQWAKEIKAEQKRKLSEGGYLDGLGIASTLKESGPLLEKGIFFSKRSLSKTDTKAFISYLENTISSLSDLKKLVETELIPRHMTIDTYSTELSALILRHPKWIKTSADIDVLFSEEYLWKKFGSNRIRHGTVEYEIYLQIHKLQTENPEAWNHEPGQADEVQRLILRKMGEFGVSTNGEKAKFSLWQRLVSTGVTSTSDQLLSDIYDNYYKEASPAAKGIFATQVLESHRIWEPSLKDKLIADYMAESSIYKDLLATSPGSDRTAQIQAVIDELFVLAETRSTGTSDFLENLSVKIRSTRAEADFIEQAKYPKSGEKVEDRGLRTLSLMIDRILDWKKKDQWDLILFLKGDIEPTKKIKKEFDLMGTERLRRTFTMMPTIGRAAFIDMLLSDPRGINPASRGPGTKTKQIVKYILSQASSESREVTRDIFDSLLYALRKTGNGDLQNFYLSYMMAYPKSQFTHIGRVLREFLDQNGTLGRKLGQFIAASEILSPADTAELRELQENASKPTRSRVYRDMEATHDPRLANVDLGEVLGGGASKYAALINTDKVFKQIRTETTARINTEFKEVEEMASHLVSKNRKQYGVLKRLVQASVSAVRRELDLPHEAKMSQIAREMYRRLSTSAVFFDSPQEELITETAMLADFAKGVNISSLSDADKRTVAKASLEAEDDVLFRDFDENNFAISPSQEIIHFDPDRHWGNSKNEIFSGEGRTSLVIRNLDFGQLQSVTVHERSLILHLVALAQVVGKTGVTNWAVSKVAEMYGLDKDASKRLYQAMNDYFPARGKPITLYYSLLSAIQDSGHEIGMQYYDFLRAQVQHNPSESLLGEHATRSPMKRTEAYTRQLVTQWQSEMAGQMTPTEKTKYWLRSTKTQVATKCAAVMAMLIK